jgi:hypothetical protein
MSRGPSPYTFSANKLHWPGRAAVACEVGKMGKKDKKKKLGRGAEKTLAKTAKNAAKRERKDRKAQGAEEEDIEVILNNLAKLDRERVAVTEVISFSNG